MPLNAIHRRTSHQPPAPPAFSVRLPSAKHHDGGDGDQQHGKCHRGVRIHLALQVDLQRQRARDALA